MWWVGDRLEAYIGTRRVAICAGDRVLLDERVGELAQAVDCIAAWLRAQRRPPRVRIWISGSLCRPFLLPGPLALESPQERDLATQALAVRAMGGMPVRVWLAAARRRDSGCLGATAGEASLAAIEAAVLPRCCGRPVIGPWWAEGSRLLASSGAVKAAAVIVRDSDSLTLLATRGQGYHAVRCVASADDDVVEATLQRWRLSIDLEWRGVASLSLSSTPRAGRAGSGPRPGPPMALAPLAVVSR